MQDCCFRNVLGSHRDVVIIVAVKTRCEKCLPFSWHQFSLKGRLWYGCYHDQNQQQRDKISASNKETMGLAALRDARYLHLMADHQNLSDDIWVLTMVGLEHPWGEGKEKNWKDEAENASLFILIEVYKKSWGTVKPPVYF